MRYLVALVALAALALPVFADDPAPAPKPVPPAPAPTVNDPKLVGPTKVEPYKIVRVNVVGLEVRAGCKWTVRDGNGKTTTVDFGQGGKRNLRSVEFVGPPGVYEVTLSYVLPGATINDVFTLDDLTHTVTIGEPPAPPGPISPGPVPPDPNPPTPPAPGTGAFVIIIADESAPTSAQQAVILGPTVEALRTAGKLRVYGSISDSDKIKAKGYDRALADSKQSPPALLVLDKNGKLVLAAKLPTDDSSTAAILKGVLAP